ncbi:MAG: hypothetical protein PW792_17010 [Acidobacteriaceae bacterium]|nr:hypothetical protein [Acidobacteriaceae bacterium]
MSRMHISGLQVSGVFVEDVSNILELSPVLEQFAVNCNQPGGMHWLGHFLKGNDARHKRFVMVLGICGYNGSLTNLKAEDLAYVVTFAEYKVKGFRTGIYTTPDTSGLRSVISLEEHRAQAVSESLRLLMERKASVAMMSFKVGGTELVEGDMRSNGNYLWATRTRMIETHLPLEDTFEKTLAKLGKSTRFNLMYYRRRLAKKLDYEFIPDVRNIISNEELSQLNAGSLNPIEDAEFRRRWESSNTLRGGFVMGVRTSEGRWLSLLGGWRSEQTTVMHWQMNTAGYEKDSLVTVMRSHFIENEINIKIKDLIIYGGTPHSMQYFFEQGPVQDVVIRRHSLRWLLLRLSPANLKDRIGFGGTNFLGKLSRSNDLVWSRVLRGKSP